jgi:hypothetical protein
MKPKPIGVIDRITEDEAGRRLATILIGREEWKIVLPLEYLPEGVGEGVILSLNWKIDCTATESQQEKIARMIEKLKNKHK